jgi:hypothetical protein
LVEGTAANTTPDTRGPCRGPIGRECRLFGRSLYLRLAAGLALIVAPTARAAAQTAPAGQNTSADDTPSIRVGAVIFTDYTVQLQPKTIDAEGNAITFNSFNVGRSYINLTGNVSHLVAFRVTPDVTRETGTDSSLGGSYVFRIKYALVQLTLDDWMPRGSWVRLGIQQTPWVEFMEGVYRYRFQGQIFPEREGFISSSDAGVAFHSVLPGDYGDVQAGIFNGEGYQRAEVNDQKAFMFRGTLRPLPRHALLHGVRVTGFWDQDAHVRNADRRRAIASITFEYPHLNAAFDYLAASDRVSASADETRARGWSIWATPRSRWGWEGLLRYDSVTPNTAEPARKHRAIAGLAYWFPHQGSVSTALMLDLDDTTFEHYVPDQPTQKRLALHALVSY